MKRVLGAGLLLVALTACHYAGNGFITSKTGTGQAQFTFDLNCKPGQSTATGTLTYVDSPAGVSIRGVPNAAGTFGAGCDTNAGSGTSPAEFSGTYQRTDRAGGVGNFTVDVTPTQSNQVNGGYFELDLTSGPHAGYHNEGFVTGHVRQVGGDNA